MIYSRIPVGMRLTAMLYDHICMTIIAMVFSIPSMIYVFSDPFHVSFDKSGTYGIFFYIRLWGFSLYFCKDVINGQSIAKRKFNLLLIDKKTGQVASPLQSFVRNIFCILWPVEVIMAYKNPSQRIGDKVAGTELISLSTIQNKKSKPLLGQVLITVLLSYALNVGISFLIGTF